MMLSVTLLSQPKTAEEFSEALQQPNLTDSAKLFLLEGYGVQLFRSDPDSAITTFQMAAALAGKMEKWTSRAGNLKNVGVVYYFRSDYEQAIHYYEQAIEAYRTAKADRPLAEALRFVGICYFEKGDYSTSVEQYYESLALYEALKDTAGLSKTLNSIGSSLEMMGEMEASLDHYRRSLFLKESIGDSSGVAIGLMNLGNIKSQQDDFDSAIYYHEKALLISKAVKNDGYVVDALICLSGSYGSKGFYSSSEEVLKQALAFFDNGHESDYQLSQIYNGLCEIYIRDQRYSEAAPLVEKNIELTRKIGAKDALKDAWLYRSKVSAEAGNYKAAYEAFQEFTTMKDSVFDEEKMRAVTEIRTKYESEKKELENQRLKAKEQVMQASLARKAEERVLLNSWIVVLGVLLAGIGLALFAIIFVLRSKQRSNKLLQRQNEEITRQGQEIQMQKEELADKNKDITDSIRYAQRIQQAILPKRNVLREFFAEAFILYRPRNIVSGDFYWFKQFDSKILVACADCTGHGVPGALMSMVGTVLLRELNDMATPTAPNALLAQLDTQIQQIFKQKKDDYTADGMDISVVEYDQESGKLKFASARCSAFLQRSGKLEVVRGARFSIGGGSHVKKEFPMHEFELKQGDSFYLFTDGFSDQFGSGTGKKLSLMGAKKMVEKMLDKTMPEQLQTLSCVLTDWQGDLEQTDDVCIIGIRV